MTTTNTIVAREIVESAIHTSSVTSSVVTLDHDDAVCAVLRILASNESESDDVTEYWLDDDTDTDDDYAMLWRVHVRRA